MKITKRQLKKLIEEEILSSLTESEFQEEDGPEKESPDDPRAGELPTQAPEEQGPGAAGSLMDKWGDVLQNLNPADPWSLLLGAVLGAIPRGGEVEEADLNRIEDEIGSALDRVIDYLRRPGGISPRP